MSSASTRSGRPAGSGRVAGRCSAIARSTAAKASLFARAATTSRTLDVLSQTIRIHNWTEAVAAASPEVSERLAEAQRQRLLDEGLPSERWQVVHACAAQWAEALEEPLQL